MLRVLFLHIFLLFYHKNKLTRYQEKATSSFIQAVACKRSSTDDEKPTQNHSGHTNEHENAPEAPVDCTAGLLTNYTEPLYHLEQIQTKYD